MPNYLAPGVYVEESTAAWGGSLPTTSMDAQGPTFDWTDSAAWRGERRTAGFVGFADRGPLNSPVLVDSTRSFGMMFGQELSDSYLAGAVDGFFANGGEACYVVRVGETSDDGTSLDVSASSFVGDPAVRSGFAGLEQFDDIGFVAAPDLWSAFEHGALDLQGAQAVQLAMIAHAELMGDRIAMIDPPPNLDPTQVKEWRIDLAGYDSMFSALYYPWIRVTRPSTGYAGDMPPSGHVAGVIARCDQALGVHLPPANAVVRQAVALAFDTTMSERQLLNPFGINALVALPGSGVRVFGARTLSSDPDWRNLNDRRLVNEILATIRNGTRWALFQMPTADPGDSSVPERLVKEISEYLHLLWLTGVLPGESPSEAFHVRSDEFTTPAELHSSGQLAVELGLALGHRAMHLRLIYFAP